MQFGRRKEATSGTKSHTSPVVALDIDVKPSRSVAMASAEGNVIVWNYDTSEEEARLDQMAEPRFVVFGGMVVVRLQ